jgi:acetyl esterase/lipase
MVLDNRFSDLPRLVALIEEFGFVAVTVDYRLAPEHPHPVPVEDCYAGLVWMADNAGELGFDPAKLIIGGGSAGGGLSAGVALLARDRKGPDLAGQLLLCPMLDDRNDTASTREYAEAGVWSRRSNEFGWQSLLNGRTSPHAAPSRATDLSGLPPAFIEVGVAEIFRDEDVEYARGLWLAGVPGELHVWAGAYHGFDRLAPDSEVTRAALAARSSWLRRIIGRA